MSQKEPGPLEALSRAASTPSIPSIPSRRRIRTGQSSNPAVALAIALAIAVVLLVGAWAWRSCSEQSTWEQRRGSESMAWAKAQRFVKERLISPGSADFGEQGSKTCVTHLGRGRYAVTGWVDSQNMMGAKLRSRFICKLRYTGDDRWRCDSVDLSPW